MRQVTISSPLPWPGATPSAFGAYLSAACAVVAAPVWATALGRAPSGSEPWKLNPNAVNTASRMPNTPPRITSRFLALFGGAAAGRAGGDGRVAVSPVASRRPRLARLARLGRRLATG